MNGRDNYFMIENLSSRKLKHEAKGKKILTKYIGSLIIFTSIFLTVSIYSIFLALTDQSVEAMKMLGQNLGTIIIAVGVSFPTIIVAVYQTKYSEAQGAKRKVLQNDLFSFVFAFVVFIGVNTLSFMALYFSGFESKDKIIAIMIGSLIGLALVFLFEIAKLTK
ncbi:hypothetical protein [Brevibacillus nitrificans]|uniref:hypothetical protein n=1 Tax=Brevibacillus nitrificans TaxID=651560 RepID=UPI0011CDDD78|nr:hypothetical protein [Brevibacillus nitrificans]